MSDSRNESSDSSNPNMKPMLKRITGYALITAAVLATAAVSWAKDPSTNASLDTADSASTNKFYGPITKLDTNKMTFVVGDQTFVVGTKTKMTTKDDKEATLADAVVGEPA